MDLHAELAPKGIQVGFVCISAWIGHHPKATPEQIAPLYWELYAHPKLLEKEFTIDK